MDSEKLYLGIDIGGTKTRIGVIDDKGEILVSRKFATRRNRENGIQTINNIISSVKAIITEAGGVNMFSSIGIGVPGTVERREGKVLFAPNLGWKNEPVKSIFQETFNLPVYVGQDTEAAALGEYLYGAGKGYKDIVCITIGTGVGCGIIIGGRIYKGKFYTAGEFGHTVVEKSGLLCGCGKSGCLEAYSSGTAILKHFKKELENGRRSSLTGRKSIDNIRTEDIFDEAKNGDELSVSVINNAIEYLSMGITNIINLICPEAVILSGGIGTEKEMFIDPLIKRTYERIYYLLVDKVKITSSGLEENAPLLGASMLFKDPLFRKQ